MAGLFILFYPVNLAILKKKSNFARFLLKIQTDEENSDDHDGRRYADGL